ncbi:zinc finger protein 33A [Amyelois transitella]|uniref:zinc finger protein 33A n=1 Tax=Amyelois transitella TaxID=680683 RepID=UPI00067C65D0|nr:zinc finger protein 33A [Amyelois transitella]XP_060803583.1 zinc finger protein 33A [Amyelois transitella]
MENEDDTFVVIIGEDEDWQSGNGDFPESVQIKQEKEDLEPVQEDPDPDTELNVENILEVASKVGEYIEIDPAQILCKTEPEYVDTEYLKEEWDDTENVYLEYNPDEVMDVSELEDNDSDFHTDSDSGSRRRKAEFRNSFVEDLRKEYPELRDDESQLVKTLVGIMKSVKRPPPPKDYFVKNDVLYECVKCCAVSDTEPAAWRHWQEKHGKRYLLCYACGVDFRSCTNLYKHEKRCCAKDASIVLKARAIFLGRKGRSRPFLGLAKKYLPRKATGTVKKSFPCNICPAAFNSKSNLQSHENLHRGLRPYRCEQCPCAYTSVSALARHKQKHKDQTFICDHCERPFKTKPTLIAHLDTHSAIRKFGCSLCDKRYAQKAALRLHIGREHLHLPPPCACQICPKRYPRMSLLKQHMKSAHGMTLMTRKMFFKSLPTLTDTQLQQAILVLKSDLMMNNDITIGAIDQMALDNTASQNSMNEMDILDYMDPKACVEMFPEVNDLDVKRTK